MSRALDAAVPARAAGTERLVSAVDAGRTEAIPQEWQDALRAVPRDAFLPSRLWLRDGAGGHRLCDRDEDPEGWIEAAYCDVPLVTQFATESDGTRSPSSSASQPSTVLRLLEDTQIEDRARVLEIGTGTGFNTALLCARLGHSAVTSLEVDPGLAAGARTSLAALSYAPAVVQADGALGWAPAAPYDRVLATCSVRTVPAAWIEQTRTGGKIVTPWDSAWCGYGTLVLTKQQDGAATGRFASYGSYMLISGQRSDVELHRDVLRDSHVPQRGTTTVSPWAVAGSELDLQFHIGLTVPGAWYSWDTDTGIDGAHTRLWLADDAATSWASIDYDGKQNRAFLVSQYGPRHLWDEVTAAHQQWLDAGRPQVDRYGMSVTPDGQRAWLDQPGNFIS